MTASTGTAPGRIFMSYRREETAYPAASLFDRLASHFGRDQIFKDVDSIELGDDFVEVITTAVGSCEVLLALIGSRWLTITDQDGHRRLDNPGDFVRLEIEAALTRNVRVIPILVDEARMPRADELPASMAKLARRQALELSPGRFEGDTRRLLRVLDRTIGEAQEEARQEAERAARHREKIEQLQGQIRERAAAQDWDAVVAVNDELAALDPAAADPDALASTARGQITRRHEAEEAAAQREADKQAGRDAGKQAGRDAGTAGPLAAELSRCRQGLNRRPHWWISGRSCTTARQLSSASGWVSGEPGPGRTRFPIACPACGQLISLLARAPEQAPVVRHERVCKAHDLEAVVIHGIGKVICDFGLIGGGRAERGSGRGRCAGGCG